MISSLWIKIPDMEIRIFKIS